MAETTIAWCIKRRLDGSIIPGYTHNSWEGCEKISPACKNCYADARDQWIHKGKHWGANAPRLFHKPAYWKKLETWEAKAAAMDEHRFVFGYSLADWLEDRADVARERLRFFQYVAHTPHLDYLLLTKRPENWRHALERTADAAKGEPVEEVWDGLQLITHWLNGNPVMNIWPGVTVENDEYAWRIHYLAEIPAPCRFISAEPLLGRLDLTKDLREPGKPEFYRAPISLIDWVITGGESGREARPSHIDDFRRLRDQAGYYDVPFHFKQHGEYLHESQITKETSEAVNKATTMREWADGSVSYRVGTKVAGRLLDGKLYHEYPELLPQAA